MSSAESNAPTLKIVLIEDDTRRLEPFYRALRASGYAPQLISGELPQFLTLSRIDLLVLDIETARRPVSSQFINVPSILVLTPNQNDSLPPWLKAGHTHMVRYPRNPADIVSRISEFLTPRESAAGALPADPEHLALLFTIARTLNVQLNLDELLERVLSLAPTLGGQFSSLLLQETDGSIYYRSSQPGREDLLGPSARRFAQRLLDKGLEGWVIRHRQVVSLPNTMEDSRWFRASYIPEAASSVVAVPLALERVNAAGVYLIGHEQLGHFTPQDVSLLEAAAQQIGQAVSNALLFKNQTERSIQLALINEVSQAATSILSLDVMLRTVVQAIQRTLAFYSVSIYLFNPALEQVELQANVTLGQGGSVPPEARVRYRLGEGIIGETATVRQTILINDVAQHAAPFIDKHPDIRSVLCVPITLGVKLIGVLNLQSTRLEAFHKYHVAALEMLADQLAIAVENARLYDEIHQRVDELKSLNEIGQAINSTLDLQETLTLITRHTTRLMNVAAASLALRDDERGEIEFAAAYGEASDAIIGLRLALGQGIAGWVAQTGEAVIVPDVASDPRFFAEIDRQSGFTTRSILCVPLQSKGRTIGAIEVMNKKEGGFNRDDQSLLQALAVSAATAIENAQLYRQAETLRVFNEDIIRHMTNGLIAVSQAGLITACNPAAARMVGCEVDAVMNQPLVVALAHAPEVVDVFQQTLATGQPSAFREMVIHQPNGTSLLVSISAAPMGVGQDGRQPFSGVVGVLEDLSEIKALEAERRRLDRLAALGEMSAVVAHEIRNPMAAIAAGVEYLTRKIAPNSPDFEGVSMVRGEIKRVNRIIEDILFMARPLPLNLSKETLGDIITSVIQRNQARLDATGVTIRFTPPPNCPRLKVDRQRLEQVFSNLIINAAQSMPDGGELTIQIHPDSIPAGELIITVADTGPGIAPDARRRIFEPFFTTRTKGTGLGLPVARRIIEEHGGSINVDSQPGQGARFIIKLPLERKAGE